jgi:hypothetical protein
VREKKDARKEKEKKSRKSKTKSQKSPIQSKNDITKITHSTRVHYSILGSQTISCHFLPNRLTF